MTSEVIHYLMEICKKKAKISDSESRTAVLPHMGEAPVQQPQVFK